MTWKPARTIWGAYEKTSAKDAGVKAPESVLFVCLGNICRSPLAEGIFADLLVQAGLTGKIRVDSAGTGGWHAGDMPDQRSIDVALRNGIDITGQRARALTPDDFSQFDLILGMDRSNEQTLRARAPAVVRDRIFLFLDHTLGSRADVPDPYYGGPGGFDAVYGMLREGCAVLVNRIAAARGMEKG